MNERAREALVAAALEGVPQIKALYRNGNGRCAIGVLNDALGVEDNDAFGLYREAELCTGEFLDIMNANDKLGWDFLTIARKIGTPEYYDAVQTTKGDVK